MTKPLNIVVIGPAGLEDAFNVLLRSALEVNTITYVMNLESLQAKVAEDDPHLIIVHVSDNEEKQGRKYGRVDLADIQTITQQWPAATCIALVDEPRLRKQAEEIGAHLSLLEGISPSRLVQNIQEIEAAQSTGCGNSVSHSISQVSGSTDQLKY